MESGIDVFVVFHDLVLPSSAISHHAQGQLQQTEQKINKSQPVRSIMLNSDKPTGIGSAPGVAPVGPYSQNGWGDVEHLFEGYNDQQKAAIQRERARRIDEQKKMFAANKLCLVLDLDHTLLNSAKAISHCRIDTFSSLFLG